MLVTLEISRGTSTWRASILDSANLCKIFRKTFEDLCEILIAEAKKVLLITILKREKGAVAEHGEGRVFGRSVRSLIDM